MVNEPSRPDPERLLEQLELQERRKSRGMLKVFLGYASGVGKSFQMLDEGRRRRERGEDVVVGATQLKCSMEVQQLLNAAEIIPPVRSGDQETIDIAAILLRRPQVVIIDGLAYDNPPGSRNAKRWQDVEQLLDAGVSVLSSINLQYIEESREEVERITGKRVPYTVPMRFLEAADEIAIVDAAPDASLLPSRTALMESNSLLAEEQKLSRLREMALLVAAEVVDRQLESYLKAHGIEQSWGTQERILVCVTPRSSARRMIASGRRNADRFHGELHVVYVTQPVLRQEDQEILEKNLAYASALGANVEVLEGLDPVDTIIRFAREKGITQIFIGHSMREGSWRRLWSNLVDRLIRSAEGIDVSVFPH
jgi:two-component system sensor histidine kinase KdpD